MDDIEASGLTVAQMAKATGVSAHTLRYYERAGLIRPVARTSGNQRRYSPVDVEWLKFLLRLRATGMPIADMREYAQLRARGASTVAARLALLETHRAGLHAQITLLRGHERALEAKIAVYRHDLTGSRESLNPTEGAENHD